MICKYDKVIIKSNGVRGEVIDICKIQGETIYTIESEEKGVPGGYGSKDSWKLFRCRKTETEKL